MDKLLIAHELGHAVAGVLQDTLYYPCSIDLARSKGSLGSCTFDDKPRKLPSKYGKYKYMSDLGGIYGELLFGGAWSPWGARSDLDSIATANLKLTEIDKWMWHDSDPLSFRACSRLETIKLRRAFVLDAHETFVRLPFIWEAYCSWCEDIDKNEFKNIVNEINSDGIEHIDFDALSVILKRIIH